MRRFVVAIDGPSGAGKSAVAKAVAREIHGFHLDTGAMYRALGLCMADMGVDLDDPAEIAARLSEIRIDVRFEDGAQHVFANDCDYTPRLRTEKGSVSASKVSAVPEVRSYLVAAQRLLARSESVVMDGRDIGTVVLPDADLKIFLTASDEERAKRRYLQNLEKGMDDSLETVLAQIRERDARDASRAASPLAKAEDAVELDSSDMTEAEVIEAVLRMVRERM